jgi:hypothetical protein
MSMEDSIKYLIWVVFFIIALLGVYALVKKLGIL